MNISELKYIRSVLRLLNDEFPCKSFINTVSGNKMLSEDNFTCYNENNVWIICCIDYWIYKSDEFKHLKNNLLILLKQESINVKFKQVYIVTQIMKKKELISNKNIFIGRIKPTIQ